MGNGTQALRVRSRRAGMTGQWKGAEGRAWEGTRFEGRVRLLAGGSAHDRNRRSARA